MKLFNTSVYLTQIRDAPFFFFSFPTTVNVRNGDIWKRRMLGLSQLSLLFQF